MSQETLPKTLQEHFLHILKSSRIKLPADYFGVSLSKDGLSCYNDVTGDYLIVPWDVLDGPPDFYNLALKKCITDYKTKTLPVSFEVMDTSVVLKFNRDGLGFVFLKEDLLNE